MPKVTHFTTAQLLATAAADYFVYQANKAIANNKRFTVALSGGTTPAALFTILATEHYAAAIDWKNVYIFWGDERCVPLDSPENNAHNASTILLDNVPIPKKNIFIIPVNDTPAHAAIYYEATLKIFFKTDQPVFNLILLGLGNDGHTASLFPNTSILAEKNSLVKEVFVPEKKEWRISFTASLINYAEQVLFLVAGQAKAAIVNTILNADKTDQHYPAQLIKNADWYVSV